MNNPYTASGTAEFPVSPEKLLTEHLQEWQDSGVDPDIFALNARAVSGAEVFDILYPNPERINTGRLNSHYLKQYYKCEEAAGWVCNGRFRQTSGPPIALDKKGKPRRYHSAQGQSAPITFLKVPQHVWQRVSENCGIPMPETVEVAESGEAIGFWEWVEKRKVPVVLIEGEKKAGCLLTLGFAAISVPGINMGYRVTERDVVDPKKAIARELHPDLKKFDDGRDVTICYDYRPGDYYQSPEFKAAATTARLFANCDVRIARLPGPEKGADDFAVAGGDIGSVLNSAESLKKSQNERLWRTYRGFSPDLLANSRYFDAEAPQSGQITAIKSGLGTGKTEYLKNKVATDKIGTQINLTYRNSLGLQLAEKLDSYHLDAHDGYMMFRNPNARLTLCVDSLLKIPEERLEGCTLIIDESVSVIKHLLTSRTLFDKRLEVLERFELACQKADRIVLTDGHQADWAVSYISRLSGKAATKIENLFRGDAPPVFFVLPEAGEPAKKFNEWYSQEILNSPCPALATDSITRAETMARQLELSHGSGILLTAKTASEPWARAFLRAPDEYIRSVRPAWLVYSPTAESGVDVSIRDYFSDVFCWFFGVIGVDEAMQMSRRVRHPERVTVACAERGFAASKDGDATYYKHVSKAIADRVSAEAAVLTDEALTEAARAAIAEQAQSPHHETYCKIKAKENLERRDLRGYLFKAFEAGGYAPAWVEAGALDLSEHFETKQECRDIEARQIFDAPDIELHEAQEIERSYSASWSDRCKAIKCRLLDRLPGIEKTPLWTWEFVRRVRFEERTLLNQLEASWLFNNPDDAEYLQRRKWRSELRTFLPDFSDRWLKLRALRGLGLSKFLDPNKTWTADSPEVKEIIKLCKKKAIANILGYPDKSPMRFINRLLAAIGVKLTGKRVRFGEKLVWQYSLTDASFTPGWGELLEFSSARMAQKLTVLEEAELLASQGVEFVPDDRINKQIQGVSGTVKPEPEPEPELIGRWGWVQRFGEWVRGTSLGLCERGTRYRMLVEPTFGQWEEVLGGPEQVRWEGQTF